MQRIKLTELTFLSLSVINILLICFANINYLTYALFVFLAALVLVRKITIEDFLLYSLFIPNKYIQLLSVLIYVVRNLLCCKKNLNKTEILFLVYAFFVGIFNVLLYNGMIFGTLFQVVFYYCFFRIIAFYSDNSDFKRVYNILSQMFPVQIITGLIELIRFRAFGDPISGTLISAHYFGVYFIIYTILSLRLYKAGLSSSFLFIKILLSFSFILMSDSKHVVVVFLVAYLISFVNNKLKIKNRILIPVLVFTAFVITGTILLTSPNIIESVSNNELVSKYVLDAQYNKKFIYFSRTFSEMKSISGLFGFGVGQFGSQISLTLSKGIIYPWDMSVSSYHYAITPYSYAVNGLMTEWYTKYGIPYSSMVLSYPLVSFIGMIAELGIIGFVWLLKIFEVRYKRDDPTFIIAFFFLTIFDTYFEIPCVFILILIVTLFNDDKIRSQFSNKIIR